MATQRTPSLLPGQIHSLSDLATSLFYSSLSTSSLSNDSLIDSLHGRQSFAAHQTPTVITSAGRAGVGSPILGRRKGPQVPSPYLSWSPFFSRGRSQTHSSPYLFSQLSWGIPEGWVAMPHQLYNIAKPPPAPPGRVPGTV